MTSLTVENSLSTSPSVLPEVPSLSEIQMFLFYLDFFDLNFDFWLTFSTDLDFKAKFDEKNSRLYSLISFLETRTCSSTACPSREWPTKFDSVISHREASVWIYPEILCMRRYRRSTFHVHCEVFSEAIMEDVPPNRRKVVHIATTKAPARFATNPYLSVLFSILNIQNLDAYGSNGSVQQAYVSLYHHGDDYSTVYDHSTVCPYWG